MFKSIVKLCNQYCHYVDIADEIVKRCGYEVGYKKLSAMIRGRRDIILNNIKNL